MLISVACAECAARPKVVAAAAGTTIECPRCNTPLRVPAAGALPTVSAVEEEDPPLPKKPTPKTRPAARDDGEDERPRKEVSAKASRAPLVAGVAAMVLLGGAAVYLLAVRKKDAPPVAKGPAANPPGTLPATGLVTSGPWRTAVGKGYFADFPFVGPLTADYETRRMNHRTRGEFRALQDTSGHRSVRYVGDQVAESFYLIRLGYTPTSSAGERQKVHDEAVNGFVPGPATWKASPPVPVTWAGRDALEVVYAPAPAPEGKQPKTVLRHFSTDAAVFLGIVRDVGDLQPQEIQRFFDLVRLDDSPPPNQPVAKKEPPASKQVPLPAPPEGWVPLSGRLLRFEANVPADGVVTVDGGGLAHVPEMDSKLLLDGRYHEVRFDKQNVTLSARLLTFQRTATDQEKAQLLRAYADRIAEPWQQNAAKAQVTWAGLTATEEFAEEGNKTELRRVAVSGQVGFVVSLRARSRKEFDTLKGPIFENFHPRFNAGEVSYGATPGWSEFKSPAGMYRVELPAKSEKSTDLDKPVTDAGATAEVYTLKDGNLVFYHGVVKAENSNAAGRRQLRDEMAALAWGATLPLPKALRVGGPKSRPTLFFDEYQHPGKGDVPGFKFRTLAVTDGFSFVAVRGLEVFRQQNASSVFQGFLPIH